MFAGHYQDRPWAKISPGTVHPPWPDPCAQSIGGTLALNPHAETSYWQCIATKPSATISRFRRKHNTKIGDIVDFRIKAVPTHRESLCLRRFVCVVFAGQLVFRRIPVSVSLYMSSPSFFPNDLTEPLVHISTYSSPPPFPREHNALCTPASCRAPLRIPMHPIYLATSTLS